MVNMRLHILYLHIKEGCNIPTYCTVYDVNGNLHNFMLHMFKDLCIVNKWNMAM